GRGAGIFAAVAEPVLVGGGRAVANAGDTLYAPDGALARGPAHAEEGDDGADRSQAEQSQHDLVWQLRQPRPQAGKGDQDEQPGDAEQDPGPRPDLLGEQGQF